VHGGRRQSEGLLKAHQPAAAKGWELKKIGVVVQACMCAAKVAAHAQGAMPCVGTRGKGGIVQALWQALGAPRGVSGPCCCQRCWGEPGAGVAAGKVLA
jgi:hypothetical protein